MPGASKGDYVNEIQMTLQPGTILVITVADAEEADVTAKLRSEMAATGRPDDLIAAAITRLAENGKPQVREVANRFIALGYTLHLATTRTPGPPGELSPFEDPARGKPAVGYLFPTYFSFTRDRDRLKNEGRASLPPGRSRSTTKTRSAA